MSKKKLFAGKLGKSTFTFILGAMLMVSVSAAVAQTQNPPAGDINATFDSVTTDSITGRLGTFDDLVVNDDITLGNAANWDQNDSGDSSTISARFLISRVTLVSQYFLNFQHYVNLGTIYTRGLYSEEGVITAGQIKADGDAKIRGQVTASSVGSFFKVRVTKQAKNYPQNASRQEVQATCPINTFLTGCSGNLWDSQNFLEFMGAERAGHDPNTCRSFARAKSGSRDTSGWSNGSVSHAAEAVCFDPTGSRSTDISSTIAITNPSSTTVDPSVFNRVFDFNIDAARLERLCLDPADCGPDLSPGGLDPWINPTTP